MEKKKAKLKIVNKSLNQGLDKENIKIITGLNDKELETCYE